MQKVLVFIFLMILPVGYSSNMEKESAPAPMVSDCEMLYSEMELEDIVDYKAFEKAMVGYNKISDKTKDTLTVIDFSKPSTDERLFVLDMKEKKLLFSSVVSHGKNSGDNYATSFSNRKGSYQSSLGFYLTGETYEGRNGYSLILNGLEKGFNDRARERSIVIHGAAYSNPGYITTAGRLGRSQGCPALPEAVSDTIIDTIKDGTLLFIYANDRSYLTRSRILSPLRKALR